ncbi:ankyrin repeat domain-containing protein 50-like [Mytilus trossulus]|uniref:ankyrin repeat domain-containing protein 50-like n=1 Tax=Mytilus trossulus TaxID=6551 RepID=UPI0030067794
MSVYSENFFPVVDSKLTTAAEDGDIEALKLCLQNGADIDNQDEYGQTALMFAAREGHLKICRLLIDKRCKMDITDEYGETALMRAAMYGHLEICRLLIDTGCKIDTTSINGYTALHYAAMYGYLQITRCLVEQGGASSLVTTHELKSVRAGHKGAVTKLLVKFDELKSKTDTEVDEVKALDDAVTQKQKTLIDLNNRLLEQTSEENLEQEITDSDEYMYELDCKIRQIRKFIKSFETNIISHDTVGPSGADLTLTHIISHPKQELI